MDVANLAAFVEAAKECVQEVWRDGTVTVQMSQRSPPWGLDRIDQRSLPLSSLYSYTTDGTGVHAYIIDTVSCGREITSLALLPCPHLACLISKYRISTVSLAGKSVVVVLLPPIMPHMLTSCPFLLCVTPPIGHPGEPQPV